MLVWFRRLYETSLGVISGDVGGRVLRAEHLLLFNWIKASRAFVVVAGTADHPDRILGKMNSPLTTSNLNHALEQREFTLLRVALTDLQALVTVAGKV